MTAPVPIVQPNDPEWLARKRLIDPRLEAAGWTVARYDRARALTAWDGPDKLEGRIKAARARVDALPQAILARASSGRLVPTEAELARREGRTYEPASVLLDRIGAERAARQGDGRRDGRRRGRN